MPERGRHVLPCQSSSSRLRSFPDFSSRNPDRAESTHTVVNTTSQSLDPAAVFAVAHSLWAACETHAGREPRTNLSECYNGMDQLMREVMRIAECFEVWACEHIAFDALNDVWPYLLQDRFGDACLYVLSLECLADSEEQDCLRVAMRLRLPIKCDDRLPLPVDLRARNTVPDSAFVELRIQSMRPYLETGKVFPYVDTDEPYDEQFGAVSFALSGMESDDRQIGIATLPTYGAAVSLATKLAPGIAFPSSFFSPAVLPGVNAL